MLLLLNLLSVFVTTPVFISSVLNLSLYLIFNLSALKYDSLPFLIDWIISSSGYLLFKSTSSCNIFAYCSHSFNELFDYNYIACINFLCN